MVYGYEVEQVDGSDLFRIARPVPAGAWSNRTRIVLHLKADEHPPEPPARVLSMSEVVAWRDELAASYPGEVMGRGPALGR